VLETIPLHHINIHWSLRGMHTSKILAPRGNNVGEPPSSDSRIRGFTRRVAEGTRSFTSMMPSRMHKDVTTTGSSQRPKPRFSPGSATPELHPTTCTLFKGHSQGFNTIRDTRTPSNNFYVA
jgi:hypothetical protein